MTTRRGTYNEIKIESLPPLTRKQVNNLVAGAASAAKIDEHGSWEFGAEFDRAGRGSAINWDLYAVGRDFHSRRTLAVIQIRQWEKTRRNGYPNVRKNYFLIGRNEDDSVFAHPVESRVIHSAIKRDDDVIRAVQKWIFGQEYSEITRQGDLAIIPMKRKPNAPETERTEMLLEDSHRLVADEILMNGNLYALNPRLTHLPGTHPAFTLDGWYKIVIGKRAEAWKFAAPTAD